MKSNLITRIFRRIIFPRMKGEFLQSINNSNPSVLDVGCGNDSPSLIKSILPSCVYTGIDVSDYNQTKTNVADNYILVSPDVFSDEILKMSNSFDVVLSSHNLELCNKREETLIAMIKALKPKGRLYLSFPSEKSVEFPSRQGTLNYYDDNTHKDLPPSYEKVLEILKENNMSVLYSTISHKPFLPWLIGCLTEPISKIKNKTNYYTWCYYGF
jgi:SAM-dependent methyltransferase